MFLLQSVWQNIAQCWMIYSNSLVQRGNAIDVPIRRRACPQPTATGLPCLYSLQYAAPRSTRESNEQTMKGRAEAARAGRSSTQQKSRAQVGARLQTHQQAILLAELACRACPLGVRLTSVKRPRSCCDSPNAGSWATQNRALSDMLSQWLNPLLVGPGDPPSHCIRCLHWPERPAKPSQKGR